LNAAGLDPLLSDTIAFFGRLEPLRAPHECVVHEGVEHGFMRMSEKLPVADEAIARAAAFFRDRTAHFSL
jgi:acetyl esterase